MERTLKPTGSAVDAVETVAEQERHDHSHQFKMAVALSLASLGLSVAAFLMGLAAFVDVQVN